VGDRTFLTLTRDFAAEVGAFKSGVSLPASVVSQTGEADNLQRYVADAADYIQNLWLDWNFLWSLEDGTLLATASSIAANAAWRSMDQRGFLFNPLTSTGYFPGFIPWPMFYQRTFVRALSAALRPTNWSRAPDGTIYLSHIASADIEWKAPVWLWPTRMATDAATHPIPGTLGDRIIICRAMITYGVREDAPEIITGASAEYADLLEKLEATCLPNLERSRQSEATHIPEPELR
jgi:hypothetical protein